MGREIVYSDNRETWDSLDTWRQSWTYLEDGHMGVSKAKGEDFSMDWEQFWSINSFEIKFKDSTLQVASLEPIGHRP